MYGTSHNRSMWVVLGFNGDEEEQKGDDYGESFRFGVRELERMSQTCKRTKQVRDGASGDL